MSSAIASVAKRKTRPNTIDGSQRLLLDAVSWQSYEAIGQALLDRPIRMTYDRGQLEFMILSPQHERAKYLLGRLIDTLAEEFDVVIGGFASATQKREDAERGLEADQSYYTRNWPRVRGKRRIDLAVDPPPDLAAEIDITHSSLDRMSIYAALGIPEVWRYDGQTLQVHLLREEGGYEISTRSPSFPAVPIGELARFLRMAETEDDTTVIRAFRNWLQELRAAAKPKKSRKHRPRTDT